MDATSEYGKLFMEDADLYNRVLLGTLLPDFMWTPLPRFFQTWLRNYIGGLLLYFLSAFLWSFFIYHIKRNVYIPSDVIPSRKTMVLQIYISMKALPWYCLLPTIFEYLAETGWTKCFPRLNNIGMFANLIHLAIYQIFVEFGTYWAHRELHDIKPLYKYLHATHHIYNKQNTLSPFAGLAFHPLDGIIQALPQYLPLFVIPVHLTTHLVAVFIEAFWTANIHDCIHANLWPVMGAGYHTIHHTTYRHNYGHYTTWMDWMFGTLSHPKDDEDKVM